MATSIGAAARSSLSLPPLFITLLYMFSLSAAVCYAVALPGGLSGLTGMAGPISYSITAAYVINWLFYYLKNNSLGKSFTIVWINIAFLLQCV